MTDRNSLSPTASHQCARYTFAPKQLHENALKQIGQYLKGTIDKGLILNPSNEFKLDCYPDVDFAGLWSRDNKHDPHCVQSCTRYVICLSDCPILWVSKLQTEIALSTMEAEYVSLSTSCRDLFPMTDLTKEICSSLSLPLNNMINMHVKIHEDNFGTLILGKLKPRRMTPPSKHYTVKYHWFCKHIGPCGVELCENSIRGPTRRPFHQRSWQIGFHEIAKAAHGMVTSHYTVLRGSIACILPAS